MSRDNPLTYLIGIACVIIFLLFMGCKEENHDELQLLSTVCIDGYLYFSVINASDCNYVLVEIDGENVRCGE